MKRTFLCLIFFSCVTYPRNPVGVTNDATLATSRDTTLVTSRISEEEIAEKTLQVFRDTRDLFQYAEDHFQKFLYGSHAKDGLTFKDFVWAFKRLKEVLEKRIIHPLGQLRSNVDKGTSLEHALSIIQSVATELHTGICQLCKELHPYERTKKRADAYSVAKLIKRNVEKFLTKNRFARYQKNLDEVIELLSTKSGPNTLFKELLELKTAFVSVGDTTATIDELKVLNRIMNRISKN